MPRKLKVDRQSFRYSNVKKKFSKQLFDRVIKRIERGERSIASIEAEGISYVQFYHHLKKPENAKMQSLYACACDARDIPALEDEAYRRAVLGVEKPVYQKGTCVGTITEYSDHLLMMLLRARRPDIFKPDSNVNVKAVAKAEAESAGLKLDEEQQRKIEDLVARATASAKAEHEKGS